MRIDAGHLDGPGSADVGPGQPSGGVVAVDGAVTVRAVRLRGALDLALLGRALTGGFGNDTVLTSARAADLGEAVAAAGDDPALTTGPRLWRLAADDHLVVIAPPTPDGGQHLGGAFGDFCGLLGAPPGGGLPGRVPWASATADYHAGQPVEDPPPSLELSDRTGAGGRRGPLGPWRRLPVDPARDEGVRKLAAVLGVPVDAVVIAALHLLLRRYTGIEDVRVGLPSGNHTLLARLASPDGDAAACITATAAALAGATAQPTARYQVGALVDRLVLPGTSDRAAVAFAIGETGPAVAAGELLVQPVALPRRPVPTDLTVTIFGAERIGVAVPDGTAPDLLADLCADLGTVLTMVTSDPDRHTTSALPSSAITRRWPRPPNKPATPVDLAGTIPEVFAAVARRHPDRAAILTDTGTVSYRALATHAAGLADALVTIGVGPGQPVGLLLDHGADTIVAILGTLLAGACYVPLDPDYPPDRLTHMVDHAGCAALATSTRHRTRAEVLLQSGQFRGDRQLVLVDRCFGPPADGVDQLSPPRTAPDAPAYVLYTSGSTGTPKGVVQTHANVLHGVRNHVGNLRITPSDRVGVITSFSFDMAVTDMYAGLLAGAAVVPVDVRRSGIAHLADALDRHGVTVYHSTPTVYRYLIEELGDRRRLASVRVVILGGEEVTRHDARRCRERMVPDCLFVNGYGATEASFAVQQHLPPGAPLDRDVLPIGHALPGYDITLHDPAGRETVLVGEIGIRSRYVAAGYWRAPELTAERFDGEGADRTYRTGDLGRRLPDGRLVYLGRLDRQVKVRGYRVELGDIEANLAAVPGVARAVAVVRDRSRLVGYVVPAVMPAAVPAAVPTVPDCRATPRVAALDPSEVRRHVAQRLPDYLVPQVIVVLDRVPLTPTGKVDVAALPDPVVMSPRQPADEPATDAERLVAAVWCELLALPTVGNTANFFEVGGDSLLLTSVQGRLADETGVRVPLVQLFAEPTVGAMARLVDGGGPPAGVVSALDRVTRTSAVRAARRRVARGRRRDGGNLAAEPRRD